MFRLQAERLRSWLALFDDVLVGSLEDEAVHPHRKPLTWRPCRRPGTVPDPPTVCLCPVGYGGRGVGARPGVSSCTAAR